MSEPELDHEKLRKTWEETPLILKVAIGDFNLLHHENRYIILRALKTGVQETEPISYTRRVLTAQEILEFIKINQNDEFKLTNVYFHLDKLKEKGFIKEVTTIGTGKRPKTFYGRTAKIFINSESMSEDIENDEFYKKLFKIVKFLNPGMSEEEIKKPFKDLNSIVYDKESDILQKWFEDHKDLLDELDIDFARLYQYFAKLLDFHNDFIKYNKEISDLFLLNDKL